MKGLIILFCLTLAFPGVSQNAQPDTWIPHGELRSIVRGDGKIYLTGQFFWIGPDYEGNTAVFNTDLSQDNTYPAGQFHVQFAIPDDAGGWYTCSAGVIGHVKADKTVETLPITFGGSGFLYSMAKAGNILYIGGTYAQVNGTARQNIAAIDLTTNTLTSWNPGANSSVFTIKVSGSTVYLGGSFTTAGGVSRNRIAAIDATTGVTTSWNPNILTSGFGYVSDMIITPGAIYFGGNFSNAGGGSPSRRNFAVVNTTTGALLAFNPRPDDYVTHLLLDGTTLYVAGEFFNIASTAKYGLAAFDTSTGLMTSFNVTFEETYGGPVTSWDISGQKLIIGGDFLKINTVEQAKLAVVDKTTGALEPMVERNISHEVDAVCVVGSKVFVGWYSVLGINGEYNTAGVAALDETTGQGFGWTPQMPGFPPGGYIAETKLHPQNNRVFYWQDIYIGSIRSSVLGAVSAIDGSTIASWNVSVTGVVTAWAFSETALYLTGDFTAVNGITRSGFAAVDLVTGAVLPLVIPYTPNYAAFEEVRSMIVHNDVLYVAGKFSFTDGGVTRNKLAAWNATTGALQPWAPQLTFPYPTAIPEIGAIHNGKAYLVGGVVARVNLATGLPDSWQPSNGTEIIDGASAVAVQGNYVYLVGGFSPGVVRVGMVTGNPTAWQPGIEDVYDSEGGVYAVVTTGSKLYVGGDFYFSYADGPQGQYFAQFDIPADVGNDPPVIATTTSGLPVAGVVSINLTQLISDPDDNLDLSTLQLLDPITEQGAEASIDASHTLMLTYETPFGGTDKVSIEVCDLLEACTQQDLNIEIAGSDLSVFNAVSPNDDGKNDKFTLLNISPGNKVTIFNRWGAVVFSMDNYDNEVRAFRGLNDSGIELPDGTYYYRIDFTDGQAAKTGFLSLRR